MRFSPHHKNDSILTHSAPDVLLPYLKSSTSVNNWFDENPKISSCLPRFVALQAHTKSSRARIIQRNLKGQLLCGFWRKNTAVWFSFLSEKTSMKIGVRSQHEWCPHNCTIRNSPLFQQIPWRNSFIINSAFSWHFVTRSGLKCYF